MPLLIAKADDLPDILERLQTTPQRLKALAKGHSVARLAERPGPKGWSPAEHLAHLRACDLVWTETIYAMLAEDEPQLPLFHPRDWVVKLKLAQYSYADHLAALTARRAELLRVLKPLPVEAWARLAGIGNGRTNVYSQALRLAGHEDVHCQQLTGELR